MHLIMCITFLVSDSHFQMRKCFWVVPDLRAASLSVYPERLKHYSLKGSEMASISNIALATIAMN